MRFNFLDRFWKNSQISNFTNIRPMAAKLFHANGQTDRYEEANSLFRNSVNALENECSYTFTRPYAFMVRRETSTLSLFAKQYNTRNIKRITRHVRIVL